MEKKGISKICVCVCVREKERERERKREREREKEREREEIFVVKSFCCRHKSRMGANVKD